MYLSSILDLWNKKIVAYEFRDTMNFELVTDTLEKAYLKQAPEKGIILHSDQGSQYTSNSYLELW
ncbi:DDE-type integrase/transposase/recombinase [uncultured Ilyobacter sp.]|uniref:DDE-type integrase/transposase/recombinase n=1 Tax=uncultured Ilyobacter sp. TaxID=544433 RepID=UPI0029F4BA2A|nr:DDE-type integrase/transposase/recombinase [uncultured Ilyobacter sp.]